MAYTEQVPITHIVSLVVVGSVDSESLSSGIVWLVIVTSVEASSSVSCAGRSVAIPVVRRMSVPMALSTVAAQPAVGRTHTSFGRQTGEHTSRHSAPMGIGTKPSVQSHRSGAPHRWLVAHGVRHTGLQATAAGASPVRA